MDIKIEQSFFDSEGSFNFPLQTFDIFRLTMPLPFPSFTPQSVTFCSSSVLGQQWTHKSPALTCRSCASRSPVSIQLALQALKRGLQPFGCKALFLLLA